MMVDYRSIQIENSVPAETRTRWQNIVDTTAAIFEVPAVVVTHYSDDKQTILTSSQTQNNPFPVNSTVPVSPHSYFEIVVQTRKKVLILNANEDPAWSGHVQINANMVSFLGFPLFWPDGEIFGTIAVLDNRERNFAQAFQDQLYHISTLINGDLQLIHTMERMEEIAPVDSLTGLRSRKSLETDFEYEVSRAVRYNQPLSIVAININNFRNINEFYGYSAGDIVLIETSEYMKTIKRKVDKLYRVEGDDFILLLPGTTADHLNNICLRFQSEISRLRFLDEQISITLAVSGTEWKQGEPLIAIQMRLAQLIKDVKGNSGALPIIG